MNSLPYDLSLFRWIESQTSPTDRVALLSLREAVCSITPTYRYLEVGSHLGGSLQPHVVDTRCAAIYSIDPRPWEQDDERQAEKLTYNGNSTARMLELLSRIPAADVAKIRTFEDNSWDLPADRIRTGIDLAFIDGEHTNSAVLRDYAAVRRFLSSRSVIAIHDCTVVPFALRRIAATLTHEADGAFFQHFPSSNVVAIVFGSADLRACLARDGWTDGLPPNHWQIVKLYLRKRCPWLDSAVKRGRQLHRFTRGA